MCSYYSGKPKACCGWCSRSGSSILILWYMLLHPGDPHGWIADWVCWNGVVTFGSFATAQGKVIEDHKYVQKEAQKNGEWLKQKACLFFMLGFVCFFSSTCAGVCVTGRRLIFWVQFIYHACVSSSIATLPVYLAYLALVELDKQRNSLKTNLWGEFSPSPREFSTPALLFHSKRNWWEEACLPFVLRGCRCSCSCACMSSLEVHAGTV